MSRGREKLSRSDNYASNDFADDVGLPSTTGGVEAVDPDAEDEMAKFVAARWSASLPCHVRNG